MTAQLQILDLVVNGPIKRHTRELRERRIYESFQRFVTVDCAGKSAEELKRMKFKVPPSTMRQGDDGNFVRYSEIRDNSVAQVSPQDTLILPDVIQGIAQNLARREEAEPADNMNREEDDGWSDDEDNDNEMD
eukprot:gene36345-44837_t